ncbi:unnamed protein product [Polarella glacialis]|uniref:Uncharacterized protein n=1 Tax=Polarella glacialis TaxID=89957 RepID=A0A813KGT9_POLGL|nr:unnamed protein product [Polarella glacialis]
METPSQLVDETTRGFYQNVLNTTPLPPSKEPLQFHAPGAPFTHSAGDDALAAAAASNTTHPQPASRNYTNQNLHYKHQSSNHNNHNNHDDMYVLHTQSDIAKVNYPEYDHTGHPPSRSATALVADAAKLSAAANAAICGSKEVVLASSSSSAALQCSEASRASDLLKRAAEERQRVTSSLRHELSELEVLVSQVAARVALPRGLCLDSSSSAPSPSRESGRGLKDMPLGFPLVRPPPSAAPGLEDRLGAGSSEQRRSVLPLPFPRGLCCAPPCAEASGRSPCQCQCPPRRVHPDTLNRAASAPHFRGRPSMPGA